MAQTLALVSIMVEDIPYEYSMANQRVVIDHEKMKKIAIDEYINALPLEEHERDNYILMNRAMQTWVLDERRDTLFLESQNSWLSISYTHKSELF